MRADVTDLLALPALYAAWWIHRRADARRAGWRRTVAVAVGVALLPVGVLATSATTATEPDGVTSGAVQGRLHRRAAARGDTPRPYDRVDRLTIDAGGTVARRS